jgi:hypothetical protein
VFRDGLTILWATAVYAFNAVYVYWQWARSLHVWWERALAYLPALLIVYVVVTVTGLIRV